MTSHSCFFESGGKYSVDPWCDIHKRSAIVCVSDLRDQLRIARHAMNLVVSEVGSIHNPDDCPNEECYQDAIAAALKVSP